MTVAPEVAELTQIAARAAATKLGFDQVALVVTDRLPLVDVFLIVSARNERNAGAISDEIEKQLHLNGVKLLRREGKAEGRWILADYGDLIVHVFEEDERHFYSLERLWSDCPVLELDLSEVVADSSQED